MNCTHITITLPIGSSLLQETCTGCEVTDSMFEMEHYDSKTLCPPCFRTDQDALKVAAAQ